MPLNDFATVASLRDSNDDPRGAGYSWWVQGGYSYREAEPGATDHDVTTAGGVKLYVIAPVFVTPEHFFAVGDGVADDTAFVRAAIAFGSTHQVMVDLPGTYGLSDQVLIDTPAAGGSGGTARLRGRRGLHATFRALSSSAQIAIGRQAGIVLEDVHFDGAGSDDEYLADAGIVALPKGGRATKIRGANKLTLLRCLVERTRGAAVQLLRDTTEFHLDHCVIRKSGRYNDAETGPERFIDPETPVLIVAGNGTMSMCELSGSTGRLLHAYKADGDASGRFEEVHIRAFGCRLQNGFRGLVHVEDQRASSTENDFLDVELFGSYFENVGTVQDSVTSGGSKMTQKPGDKVDVFLAEGPTARLKIIGGTKIMSRRATSGFRAINGGVITVDLKGTVYRSQESLSDGAVMFDTTGGATAGLIHVLTMPTFVSETGIVGDMDEKGPAGRKMITDLIKEDVGLQVRSVLFSSQGPLGELIDGTSIAQVTSINGVTAPTLNSVQVSPLHLQGSTIEVQGAGDNIPDFVLKTVSLPPRTKGRWIRFSYLAAWKQVGASFGSAGKPISAAMRVLDGATSPAVLGNGGVDTDAVVHGRFEPTSPGVDGVTPWLETQAIVFVREPGNIDLRIFLTTQKPNVDDKMYLQEVTANFVV